VSVGVRGRRITVRSSVSWSPMKQNESTNRDIADQIRAQRTRKRDSEKIKDK
jgi:hypothetical protein